MSDTPPLELEGAVAVPLNWSIFDAARDQWVDLPQLPKTYKGISPNNPQPYADSPLSLVTWNIDAHAYEPVARLLRLLEAIYRQCSRAGPTDTAPRKESDTPDVIFLQEVSSYNNLAPDALLQNDWIRGNYYVSGVSWFIQDQQHPVYSLTMVSRHRFETDDLGPLWRIDLPSRYGRYALCCDLGLASSIKCDHSRVYRLVNAHLDRGTERPNKRPQQMQILTEALKVNAKEMGISGGVIAGDFCPVIPEEDDEIVSANGLIDCWTVLQPGQEGNTWVPKARESYPPCRMDKITVTQADPNDTGLNDHLTPRSIEVLRPGMLKQVPLGGPQSMTNSEVGTPYLAVPWSNHCGLYATFTLSTH